MKKQAGFTLIELVIVVIILGLLAATALPRFLNITEQAEEAAVEGIAGGFAAAIGLVRAQWEVAGRPADAVNYDGILVQIGTNGYPTGGGTIEAIDADQCSEVLNQILQNPPQATTSTAVADIQRARLFVRATVAGTECQYYQTAGLTEAPTNFTNRNGFRYVPATGRVTTETNKN